MGTGKSETINATKSSAPAEAGRASRPAQHREMSPRAWCTARALAACGRRGFRTCPHADAASELGKSMPSMDPSLLASVVAAEDGLGREPTQDSGEAKAGLCGMPAVRQEDAEPDFPAA